MDIPFLDIAKTSVWFYHDCVVSKEAAPGDLFGLGAYLDLGKYYADSEEEAKRIYKLYDS